MNAYSAIVAAGGFVDDDPPSPPDDGIVHVGLVRLWGRDLAVRADQIREVVPRPSALQPAFSTGGTFIGSVVIRTQVVPVVDVSATLGFPKDDEGPEPGVVVVLRRQHQLIGLLVHSVLGLSRVRAADIQDFQFQSPHDLHVVASSFVIDDRLIGIVDMAGIASLPGVPRVREAVRQEDGKAGVGQQKVLMLSIAGAELAIDAAMVAATIPGSHVHPAPSITDDWTGVVRYLDQEVPVIDDTALLGLAGRAADTRDTVVIVLRFGDHRLLGIKADRVRRIIGVHAKDIRALPPGVAHLPLFAGAIGDGSGGQSLLLQSDALRQDDRLQAIARLTRRNREGASPGGARCAGKDPQGMVQAYLIFRIGDRRRACLLADISQIMPMPRDNSRLTCPGSSLWGLAGYRGGPLALVDLSGGEPPDDVATDNRMVLVVEAEGSATGFVVDALDTTVRAVAQPLPPMMRSSDADTSFVQVRIAGRDEAVHVCSLRPDGRQPGLRVSCSMDEQHAA